MIYISQGHEKGIGLEIFLKSFLCLNKEYQKKFILSANKDSLVNTLDSIKLNYKISASSITIGSCVLQTHFLQQQNNIPQSTTSLLACMQSLSKDDILLTLPTSKDQLILNNRQLNGHTELFRSFYNNAEIGMLFIAPNCNVLLLSDHINTDQISSALNIDSVIKKVQLAIQFGIPHREIRDIYFSGINPHCGEHGNISNHDNVLIEAIDILKPKFPYINFYGPFAGDTLHFKFQNKNQLFVYAHHDQGLAPFKLKYGLTGINYTTGLPFKRVSVDHGTAFDLYGKNQANYLGMLYLLKELENWT